MGDLRPDVEALLTEVGRTLLLWGLLETQMIEAQFDWKRSLSDVDSSDPDYSILRDLKEPRAVRNALAHGITGALANPWADVEGHVVCRMFDRGERMITFGDMRRIQAQITQLRRMFRLMSASSAKP